ncbi:MAG TPA: VTT domain-containing protein [Moraxellaceae bacterium]|nr:VTT domain-containing protein [Moraxellaceae bacterium]
MDIGASYLELRSWLIHHPDAILAGVFLVALVEAVAVVGVIVPAVPLLFVLCVLAAHAEVSLLSLFLAGIAGAMLGDGISYALGKGFKHRVHRIWPFSRYPDWLQRSEDFVERHGGKGIIFGRFIGPLRAFVPMAAGIFRMKPLYFLWMNFLSALVWAPFHLLPGYSLGAAAAHSWLPGRPQLIFVAVVLIAVAVLTWLLPWLALRRQQAATRRPLPNSGLYHTRAGLPEDQRAALRTALVAALGFALIAAAHPWLHDTDVRLTAALYSLRQPSLDWLFVPLSLLGERRGLLAFAAVLAGWLALRKDWPLVALVGVASVVGLLLPEAGKAFFGHPRPQWVAAPPASHAFPSGHAFNAVLVWGLVLVLLARYGVETVTGVARPFLLSLMLLTMAGRPYLGVHWLADVAGGGLLGLACLCLLRCAWHRLPPPRAGLVEMATLLVAALAVAIVVAVLPYAEGALLDYQPMTHLPVTLDIAP